MKWDSGDKISIDEVDLLCEKIKNIMLNHIHKS
ncbi:hypothetical protein PANA5342_1755 [Pantoea ananatis LMG 5342]|nr:hypothetical protein PANA5342_1755 [Pantoea ananatis LMG 5342]